MAGSGIGDGGLGDGTLKDAAVGAAKKAIGRKIAAAAAAAAVPLLLGGVAAIVAVGGSAGSLTTEKTETTVPVIGVVGNAEDWASGSGGNSNGNGNGNGGSSSDYTGEAQKLSEANSKQKAIVDACNSVGSPGGGLCAMWVSQVYEVAGVGYPGGNACNMYDDFCTSSDKNDLKVGMIVAVPSHTHTEAGSIYGHVAIYIGDGQVMDNIGYIRTISLDEWIDYYSTTYTVKWGFAASGVA